MPDLWDDQAWFRLGRTNSTAGDGVRDASTYLVLHVPVDKVVGPVIVSQPIDQDVLDDDTVTFSVAASAGEFPLAYQWACNGTNIHGATASSHTMNSVQSGDAAGYSATVSTGAGTGGE